MSPPEEAAANIANPDTQTNISLSYSSPAQLRRDDFIIPAQAPVQQFWGQQLQCLQPGSTGTASSTDHGNLGLNQAEADYEFVRSSEALASFPVPSTDADEDTLRFLGPTNDADTDFIRFSGMTYGED